MRFRNLHVKHNFLVNEYGSLGSITSKLAIVQQPTVPLGGCSQVLGLLKKEETLG